MSHPSVKIIVGYHRPAELIQSDIFCPLHLGRALMGRVGIDGELKQDEYSWMLKHMIGDDTGDNISHDNKKYCELTGLYWAWKNYSALGTPDYIGFTHYRRLFDFSLKNEHGKRFIIPYLTEYEWQKRITGAESADWSAYDLYTPGLYPTYKLKTRSDGRLVPTKKRVQNECQYPQEIGQYELSKALEYIKRRFPSYAESADAYMKKKEGYFWNMMILRKELFFEYCEILFKTLHHVCHEIDFDSLNLTKRRICGYIGEKLTGVFIYHKMCDRNTRTKALNTLFIKHTQVQEYPQPWALEQCIPVSCFCSREQIHACMIMLQSLIEHSNKEKYYDVIILHDELSDRDLIKLSNIVEAVPHISVRTYNIGKLLYNAAETDPRTRDYRFHISTIFQNYRKIILLPPAVIVLEDIAKIYDEVSDTSLIGTAYDFSLMAKHVEAQDRKSPQIGIAVSVINIEKWIQHDIENKWRHLLGEFLTIDAALQAACKDHIYYFASAWCTPNGAISKDAPLHLLPASFYEEWKHNCENPKIIYYCTPSKPWYDTSTFLSEFWWKYARKTPYYEEFLTRLTQGIAKLPLYRRQYKKYCWLARLSFGKKKIHYLDKKKKTHDLLMQMGDHLS